jgi:hypothetical protein
LPASGARKRRGSTAAVRGRTWTSAPRLHS